MKSAFILATSICLLIVAVFTAISFFRKKSPSKIVSNLLLSAFFVLFFYLLTLFSDNIIWAKVMFSLRLLSISILLGLTVNLVIAIGNISFNKEAISRSNLAFFVFVGIDFGMMMLNISSGYYFQPVPFYDPHGNFISWTLRVEPLFFYHISLSMLLIATVISFSIKIIRRSLPFYRTKYIFLLLDFCILVALNNISNRLFLYDYSIYVAAVIAIHIYYLVYYSLPDEDFRCILSLSSDESNIAIANFDMKGKCTYANNSALNIFGTGEWGKISAELFAKKYNTECTKQKIQSLYKEEQLMIDEEPHYMNIQYQQFFDKRNRFIGSYIKFEDRSEDIKRYEIEKYRSSHDPLTGLYNRMAFFEKARKIIQEHPDVKRYMIATDIRNFKLFNELFGTEFADKVLQTQAHMLMLAKGNDDSTVIARMSGDHFAMMISAEKFNPELAIQNTEKIQVLTQKYNFHFQMYLGAYEITNPYERIAVMYDKASLAISNIHDDYNKILNYYDQPLMELLKEKKTVLDEFQTAIAEGQYLMYLQPQIDAVTGKVTGAEALVRRQHPIKGLIFPNEFIPTLEDSGYIYLLDQYVWEEACKKLSEWKQRGIDLHISINISAKDFYYCDLYKILTDLVHQYNIDPGKLNIEITETILMHEVTLHKQVLSMLKDFGFSIEMDDFGSGYSSLNAVKDLKMDVLKIDMEFLHETENTNRSKLILKSIIAMAKALGMKVITEGVETKEQADYLKEIGTDIFQGYYYSKPISVPEFEKKYTASAEGAN